MKEQQRDAVLLDLIQALTERESWGGETHVQKSTYFLQELTGVPLGFDFFLYKYGPYAYDLSDALSSLRADHLVQLEVRKSGYGASIVPTGYGKDLIERYPKTRARHRKAVDLVAERVGTKSVAELERVATALLVTRKQDQGASIQDRASEVCVIKPHVDGQAALDAVRFVDELQAEWERVKGQVEG